MFHSLFDAADPTTFRVLASDHKVPSVEPLRVSPWVAMSAMQKGIRRGDVDLAARAATTLLKVDPTKLWRRLAGIVVEDIGLADLECVKLIMAATAGKTFRREFGGEHRVAGLVIARMCEAKKCRAADDLFIVASHHPELEALRADMARVNLSEHLSRVGERCALLGASLAALHASGARWNGQVAGRSSDAPATFAAMSSAGIDDEIVALAEQGFRRTREALPVLLPLLILALPSGELPVEDNEFPAAVIGRDGLPTFVYDGFSWEGKSALSRFLRQDTTSVRWLRKHVPAERRVAVLHGAIFRVEGGLVRQRVRWPCAETLRRLADEGYHGMRLPDPAAFLDMIRADLPVLDEVRHDL
ncbi:hypothetical protein [Mesorhizobium australicum]|uniref:hypothetical protein n=1 Tax=Mesorhizobium australicum TaxID=536018 RepID=UPI003337CA04